MNKNLDLEPVERASSRPWLKTLVAAGVGMLAGMAAAKGYEFARNDNLEWQIEAMIACVGGGLSTTLHATYEVGRAVQEGESRHQISVPPLHLPQPPIDKPIK